MQGDEFMRECIACGGNWGAMILTGIARVFPESYEEVKEHYNSMDFSDGGVEPFAYLCDWLTQHGVVFEETAKEKIEHMLFVKLSDEEYSAMEFAWAAFCKDPEKYKDTVAVDLVAQWLKDYRGDVKPSYGTMPYQEVLALDKPVEFTATIDSAFIKSLVNDGHEEILKLVSQEESMPDSRIRLDINTDRVLLLCRLDQQYFSVYILNN